MLSCQTLIFDLDNTLFDRNASMRLAMQHWLQQHPEVPHTLDEIMERDGGGYTDRIVFCNWLMGTADAGSLLKAIQQQLLTYLQPDEAILQMLCQLKRHYQLVLASNGGSEVQRAKLAACGLTAYFPHIFISGEMGKAKPAPAFFHHILDTLALNPADVLMIGDDPVNDIQAAQQCGIKTCWISQGRAIHGINPEIVIEHITELYQ
jgi:HAD superfamily hydrolase (TIGR01549 family)